MDIIHQIEINSIEKAEDILQEAGTEQLFKAAQFHFKYIDKVFKNGHVRYIYANPKNVRKIKGKKKKLSHGREITIDRKDKFMLRYTEELRTDLISKISKLNGLEITKPWKKAKKTDSYYIHYKMNGMKYKVRSSDHSTPSERNEVVPHVKFNNDTHYWLIEASLGKYQPDDVVEITKNIDTASKKYDTDKFTEKLTTFATKYKFEPQYEDECQDMAHSLTEKYINDNHLKDDKYGTLFQVIYRKAVEALSELVEN